LSEGLIPDYNLVFVYGTLRPGGRNHDLLATATHCGTCRSSPRYILYDTGPYPAAVEHGTTRLKGDVFLIDDATLAKLDLLENVPVDYQRTRIETEHGLTWLYLWQRVIKGDWPCISDGDWNRYCRDLNRIG